MKTNWLWDSRLSETEAKKILRNEEDPRFDLYAEKLLSRVNDPRLVFNIVDQEAFCRKWPTIKKRMRKDRWLEARVSFWQTIYERIHENLKRQGIRIRQPLGKKIPPERMQLAKQMRAIRMKLGYTQRDIARKLGVIQQYVSKVETGHENLSIDALKRVAGALGKKLTIQLR